MTCIAGSIHDVRAANGALSDAHIGLNWGGRAFERSKTRHGTAPFVLRSRTSRAGRISGHPAHQWTRQAMATKIGPSFASLGGE